MFFRHRTFLFVPSEKRVKQFHSQVLAFITLEWWFPTFCRFATSDLMAYAFLEWYTSGLCLWWSCRTESFVMSKEISKQMCQSLIYMLIPMMIAIRLPITLQSLCGNAQMKFVYNTRVWNRWVRLDTVARLTLTMLPEMFRVTPGIQKRHVLV